MESCATCHYYNPAASTAPTNAYGLCRCESPTTILANSPTGTFPEVRADWWCGKYYPEVEDRSPPKEVRKMTEPERHKWEEETFGSGPHAAFVGQCSDAPTPILAGSHDPYAGLSDPKPHATTTAPAPPTPATQAKPPAKP